MSYCSRITAHPGIPKALAFAAFLALISSHHAHAAITLSTVSGDVSALASGAASEDKTFPTQTGVIYDSATSQNSNLGSNHYATSRIFASADGPQYGGSSFSAGSASTSGSLQKNITFTATQAGSYSLTTYLYGGSLQSSIAGIAAGSGNAAYSWGVSVNGSEVLASTVNALFSTSGGSQVSTTGSGLFGFSESITTSGAYASWGGTSLTTQLGQLAANQDVNISFYMGTSASSNYSFNSGGNSGPYGYGYGYGSCDVNYSITEVAYNGCGSSRVSFGDPLSIDGGTNGGLTNLAFGSSILTLEAVSPVPEPGEWALMLTGLMAVGAIAKRRRKQT